MISSWAVDERSALSRQLHLVHPKLLDLEPALPRPQVLPDIDSELVGPSSQHTAWLVLQQTRDPEEQYIPIAAESLQ